MSDTGAPGDQASFDFKSLDRGFRAKYLSYNELTDQLKAWQVTFPDLTRLESLGTTEEGREIWAFTVGHAPDEVRPTFVIDGNMHACELAGSSVALSVAESLLRLLTQTPLHGEGQSLPGPVVHALQSVRAFIIPRISPDGAERVLDTHCYVRSVPRDERTQQHHARFIREDMNGDGRALSMRVQDPTGEYIDCPDIPGLLLPRTIDDEGPFYKLYPEGRIEGFDGYNIPTPNYLSDNEVDLNRNFPFNWQPEPEQAGAGRYPMSRREARAVVEFGANHPEIFAWLNMHTFGGVFIRPLGDAPDSKMPPEDLALYRQLESWAEDLTGYPMVSGFHEFTYEPDKPIHGDLSEWAFAHRGAVSYVCELWDLFARLDKPRPPRFVDHYSRLTRDDLARLHAFDREENDSRIFVPWEPIEHPQLGKVEVGGIDPIVGLWNPPYAALEGICQAQVQMSLRVASLAPRLQVHVERTPLSDDATLVDIRAENIGYLGTHALKSAERLPHNEALYLEAEPQGSSELSVTTPLPIQLGHLDGWGRGLFSGDSALYMMASRGTTGRKHAQLTVKGRGDLWLRVGSSRVGYVERVIKI